MLSEHVLPENPFACRLRLASLLPAAASCKLTRPLFMHGGGSGSPICRNKRACRAARVRRCLNPGHPTYAHPRRGAMSPARMPNRYIQRPLARAPFSPTPVRRLRRLRALPRHSSSFTEEEESCFTSFFPLQQLIRVSASPLSLFGAALPLSTAGADARANTTAWRRAVRGSDCSRFVRF